MMFFIGLNVGVVIGVAICIAAAITTIYFRNPIERVVNTIEKNVRIRGPRPKGYVVEANSEIDDRREEIIQRNSDQGRETPIDDLL